MEKLNELLKANPKSRIEKICGMSDNELKELIESVDKSIVLNEGMSKDFHTETALLRIGNEARRFLYGKSHVESLEKKTEEPISDKIEDLIEDVYDLRKEAMKSPNGEYDIKNLIFKEFRSLGYLDNLKDLRKKAISNELSLEQLGETLNEAREAPLYHGTSLANLSSILSSDTLKQGIPHGKDFLKAMSSGKGKSLSDLKGGVSLTRSKAFAKGLAKGGAVLVLNQEKLSNNHKFTLTGDNANLVSIKRLPARRTENSKAEEVIYKDISPLNKYLLEIDIDTAKEELDKDNEKLAREIENYSKKYNIPIVFKKN